MFALFKIVDVVNRIGIFVMFVLIRMEILKKTVIVFNSIIFWQVLLLGCVNLLNVERTRKGYIVGVKMDFFLMVVVVEIFLVLLVSILAKLALLWGIACLVMMISIEWGLRTVAVLRDIIKI